MIQKFAANAYVGGFDMFIARADKPAIIAAQIAGIGTPDLGVAVETGPVA